MDERIYLISIGGYPNYGDEFITAAWLRFLAKSRPEAEVWLDTRYPGTPRRSLPVCIRTCTPPTQFSAS